MIRQATTPRAKLRFYHACRGKLCLGATMPLALELLGKSQPGRFFAGPTLALDIGGSSAWMAGHANPEELAGFLTFCGCSAVVLENRNALPENFSPVEVSTRSFRPVKEVSMPNVAAAF